ncbi:MAG: ABC transporter substrate-binding protein, partial [Dethiobacteria bacterium]|nr:ABC transporter substrate-binding protein [Dethiobacteria bacterium]
ITHAPELDPELVNLSQEWLADKYQGDAETWGLQQKETWEAFSRWLYDYGLIDQLPDMEKAFTNRFLR